ncbi:MAG: chemotaxis protein CheD [Halorientalis sp.]
MSDETADMYTGGATEVRRERRVVGVANYVVATAGETLVAYGLGACVAVGLYDEENGVGALAHTMLPEEPEDATAAPGKYADTTLRAMLQDVVEAGGAYGSLEGWMIGGADIFPVDHFDLEQGVGVRTAEVARRELESLDIPIVAEQIGGTDGRTVEFDTASGERYIRRAESNKAVIFGDDNPN